MASLRAALKPTATSYLYFVAKPDGSGRHAFPKPWNRQRRRPGVPQRPMICPLKGSKHALLEEQIATVDVVDETVWETLKRDLAPISESYLRHLIKQSGRPMTPLVEGVNMSTPDDAVRTLRALAAEYESGDPYRRKRCRALVLEAKERIRWQLHRSSQPGSRGPTRIQAGIIPVGLHLAGEPSDIPGVDRYTTGY